MTWWQTLSGGGGLAGLLVALRYVLRNRRLRTVAADLVEGDDARVSTITELRGLMEEQRQALSAHIASATHLATRVGHLEETVEELRRALALARTRERELEEELARERALSTARIAELERRLVEYRQRIEELEARLASHG